MSRFSKQVLIDACSRLANSIWVTQKFTNKTGTAQLMNDPTKKAECERITRAVEYGRVTALQTIAQCIESGSLHNIVPSADPKMPLEKFELKGWRVHASECGQYLYVERDGKPGEIHIKAETEGFVVDVYGTEGISASGNSLASIAVEYVDCET